ncbi:related to metallopeptidase MepB [Phialocephala subalpina]|uniref:Related to metallopeptidase MepB n=1 Tax=Phialocephala subalpina TaxID=576137 RepID=A0A1L7XK66_9HELO|nr:related to metallopeptidase MepB [Phialocephala subalpina]
MPPQAPPNLNATPESLISNTQSIIDRTRTLQDSLIALICPEDATFANVLLPLAHDENESLRQRKISKSYNSTSTSSDLREASSASEILFTEFESQTLMREDLFRLFDAVSKRGEKLDAESQFYLEHKHQEFARNGMGIEDAEKRARFTEIKKELHEKLIAARKSINTSAGTWLDIEDLDGLPENTLKGLKSGEGENEKKLWLPFKKPYLDTVLKYATNPATRRKIYIGNDNRCPDNVPRLKEIVLLRDEAARLLGYKNHAEFQLEVKMAASTDFVNDFLNNIREKLTPIAMVQLQALKELKAQVEGENENDMFYIWDYNYYTNISKIRTNSFHEKLFSEYFTLEPTLAGMLTTFSQLFGLEFNSITPNQYSNFRPEHVMVWHDSVSLYSVWNDDDGGGDFLGYLYLDLFPRENKYNHAGHYLLQPVPNPLPLLISSFTDTIQGYTKEDGTYYHPSSALVMNLPSSTPHKPTLLSHDSIRSLFHELGHAIHNLGSRTTYATFHGTACARDFVEIPSIMLENWWWTPSIIKSLGRHYSYLSTEMFTAWQELAGNDGKERPAEILEDETINNLVKSRRTNEALATLRQIHIAMFDMAIHSPSSREEVEGMNLNDEEGWEWGHGSSRLGAIVRGYDAGYYAYPLGKTYAQDLFTEMFEEDPMSKSVGMRYRETVLQRGGSRNGMELMEQFLGRKPNAGARYRELGLS